MVMTLKESESKLQNILEKKPDNIEVPAEESDELKIVSEEVSLGGGEKIEGGQVKCHNDDKPPSVASSSDNLSSNNLKKVTNIENEQINKTLQNNKNADGTQHEVVPVDDVASQATPEPPDNMENIDETTEEANSKLHIEEIESIPLIEPQAKKDDHHLNEVLRKNILSCVEKVAIIEELKNKKRNNSNDNDGDQVSVY